MNWIRSAAGLFLPRPYLGFAEVSADQVFRFAVSSGPCCGPLTCYKCLPADYDTRQVQVDIPAGNVDNDCGECDEIAPGGPYYLDWHEYLPYVPCNWEYEQESACQCDDCVTDTFYVWFTVVTLMYYEELHCYASVRYGFSGTCEGEGHNQSWYYADWSDIDQTSFTLPYVSRTQNRCDDPRPCVHEDYPATVTAEILAA